MLVRFPSSPLSRPNQAFTFVFLVCFSCNTVEDDDIRCGTSCKYMKMIL